MATNKCIVLVPIGSHVEPECERGLARLETRGYVVRRVSGHAAIDQGRSQMATDALAEGFDEIMWVDSDVDFDPDSVDRLRAHNLPIVCGIYPKKGVRALSCHLAPNTPQVVFGAGGGLLEITYAATGFLHTRRVVYETMREKLELPTCNESFARPIVPYFLPMIVSRGDKPWYLGEDFSFCERARRCDFAIMADTTFRLRHIGRYGYTWEDAGSDPARYASYTFHTKG
ncbi:MAG: hypothetical protein JWO86_4269 [Myxococcaceae bacterium]|nr:hypothetical protein [Myxococcaceae bacterium]